MNPLPQFLSQRGIHHAVLVDPRLAAEGFRDDFDTEMAFTIWPGAGMAGVLVGLVNDLKRRRREINCIT